MLKTVLEYKTEFINECVTVFVFHVHDSKHTIAMGLLENSKELKTIIELCKGKYGTKLDIIDMSD